MFFFLTDRSVFFFADTELTAENYGVRFTPRREYRFVFDPLFDEPMDAGRDPLTSAPKGRRQPVPLSQLLVEAVPRMQAVFVERNWCV